MSDEVRVTVVISFPQGTPREVINDRLRLVNDGVLSLPNARGFMESWDTRGVPTREEMAV